MDADLVLIIKYTVGASHTIFLKKTGSFVTHVRNSGSEEVSGWD
jgi:hypothetical protein